MKSKLKAYSKLIIKSPQIEHYSFIIWIYFCPIRVSGCKIYAFFIEDYYTRFTLGLFIAYKDEALEAFSKFYKRIQNEKKII